MKILAYIVIAFSLYYTAAHLYERAGDVYWWYNESASAWSNQGCPAHPELGFDLLRAEIILKSVNDDPNCKYPGYHE